MFLQAFSDNPFGTNCWLLSRSDSQDAIVIDPGFYPERVKALLGAAGKLPVAVLATHGHFDHVAAAAGVCGSELPFYIHKEDELAVIDPRSWGAGFPAEVARPALVRTFSDGDVLDVAGLELEVIHTPGHTPGSACFRAPGLVFSGDLVFRGGIGRYDFPNSSAEDMLNSLRKFLSLPDALDVHPGHGDSTTVGSERISNPFLAELR